MMPTMSKSLVQLSDLSFEPYISEQKIQERLYEMGAEINSWNLSNEPLIISVLNGAFVFTADLIRELNFTCEVAFLQLNSYDGTRSRGEIAMEGAQLGVPVRGRDVLIMEDIVDSGLTMYYLLRELKMRKPASIRIITLLHKPSMQEFPVTLDLKGFEIPPDFVVGYGLDYRGLGRNLRGIYKQTGGPEPLI
jgi:hypoxanthine phosphoribosyltransferase